MKMESDTESQGTYAAECCFEVEDLSPPKSPEVGTDVVEDPVPSRICCSRWLH